MPADHILAYARDLAGGGVESALVRLATGWLAAGRRVTLVLGRAAGPLADALPDGIAIDDLGARPGRGMAALAARLPDRVRRHAPDVLFCPGNHYTGLAALTRVRLGRRCPPVVAKMSNAVRRGDHGVIADWGHRRWLALHGRFLDHLVAMTPATAAVAAAATGMRDRVSVIPNPPALRPSAPPPLPPLPDSPFVLGVGRLARQKRWDRLVDAMPGLGDAPVVIAGGGEGGAALQRQAQRLGVADRLWLPGHLPDPQPVMARAAVMALVSDFEGVPGVLAEALAVGTPVVATESSPAVAELVHAPLLGDVVARGDAAALAAALNRRLAPDAPRPAPQPPAGADAAARYLDLFDRLMRDRIA